MKRKLGFVDDTERAIQLSLIDSFEACDLCGLVLKACDLINKAPLLADFNYHEMSEDERARMFLGALAPEVFNRVIAAYTNEQKILHEGGSYCFNANCLRLISTNCGTVFEDNIQKLTGGRERRVCSCECYLKATFQCNEVRCELYQLDKLVN